MIDQPTFQAKFSEIRPLLNERQLRLVALAEAKSLGHGGIKTRFLISRVCNVLHWSWLKKNVISRRWLHLYPQRGEDALLVGLRGGDFVKLHSGHCQTFSADCAQAFDDTAQSPLAVFVGSVGGEEAL